MADIVSVQTIDDVAGVKHVSKMTNISDGTGETLVTKIDHSNTNAMTEDENTKVLTRIWYSINTTNSNTVLNYCGEEQQMYYDIVEWSRTLGFKNIW